MSSVQRILVVDDERSILHLLRFIFEEAGFQVVTAQGAQMARTHFTEDFRAAVIDKHMPDGDGVDLGAELRLVDPFCETILLTGYSNKEAAIEAVGAGFYAYVEKPIGDLQRFLMTVKNAVIKSDLQHRQQRSERLIEHMRKMDALGRLASGVAHDFNNVLAVVGLTAEILANEDLTIDEVRTHARQVLEVVGNGRTLARQLMVFGRGTEPQQRPVLLNDIIGGMRTLLQSAAKHRSLQLNLETDLWSVIGDADQLNQIVLNLVVNAIDATEETGHVKISTRNVAAGAPELHDKRIGGKSAVVLTVEDDGCGMPAAIIEHIFEPYFTTKAEGKGTGLGLPTVFGIVERHGGRVTVSSDADKGSRFDVYLPAAD